jgi:predicted ribosomally synthesized peptide with nif11-like leader
MSHIEVERFVADVNQNQALLQELSEGLIGLDDMVHRARTKGYDFSVEEAKAFAQTYNAIEVSDEQLDRVNGGQGIVVTDVNQVVVTDVTQVVVALIIGIVAKDIAT